MESWNEICAAIGDQIRGIVKEDRMPGTSKMLTREPACVARGLIYCKALQQVSLSCISLIEVGTLLFASRCWKAVLRASKVRMHVRLRGSE